MISGFGGGRLPVKRGYGTQFSIAENPISENGKWLNGAADALDWKNVIVSPAGFSHGENSFDGSHYDDSVAILSGVWHPNQGATAKVRSVNQNGSINQEVEIHLRNTIGSHLISGYEVLWKCTHDGSQYADIVRWPGPIGTSIGDFAILVHKTGADGIPGISDGDIVTATIVGNTISSYVNGVLIAQVTDSTYASGNPGQGFWLNNSGGSNASNADFGFVNYTAFVL